ncbi:spore germination protein [Alicyclobacillus cycloheptanicus]|uniref:GerA spore germination protein n=1 Tax=Alicyclobacillus cycloheptanicus TaxID=1457 RepID=A0ABT9XDK8_9BACL|nr:spore germination protein [Alicyclobacillus cycloheptanicus]MDQ0188384.1 hypothetical protein [Alicyclobacillus cycloheptanicus]WDM01090.1 spore germination protein [Alicyclobacillus cycloheptanicus]
MNFLHGDKRRGQQLDGREDQIVSDIRANQDRLEFLFGDTQDVKIEHLTWRTAGKRSEVTLVYCEGLCDLERLERSILPQLRELTANEVRRTTDLMPAQSLPFAAKLDSYRQVIRHVFQGQLVVFGIGHAFSVDIAKKPNRLPEDSKTEISLLGARDGFVEDLTTNIALVRKRLNTASLSVLKFEVGKFNSTSVGILFVKDACSEHIIEALKRHMASTDVISVESGPELVEMLNPSKYAFIPKYRVSGRPDFVAQCLRRGKFAILVDGEPLALLAPINLSFLMTAADDMYATFPFVTFERIIRAIAFIIALFVPGFYVGITALHPDEVPLAMLATLVNSRIGLPWPTPIEAFVMLMMFEIFKESGTHLPQPSGNILSTVGGLIIGDAAIRAGMASPALVVAISASAVALYAITNHALAGVVSILRLGVLLLSSFFGLFGFILACIFVVTYFAQIRSFGMPFLAPTSPFHWHSFYKTYVSNWPQRKAGRT